MMKRLIFLLLIAFSASAQQYDVFVTGDNPCSCGFTIPWFQSFGSQTFSGGTVLERVASAPGGRLLGTLEDPTGPVVVEVSPNGTYVPRTAPLLGYDALDIVVAPSGAFHLLATTGATDHILSFDATGALTQTFDIGTEAVGSSAIALAADGCTIAYSTLSMLQRFNVCTGTALPPIGPILGAPAADVQALPDGGYLLAMEHRGIVRLDASGAETRTYSLGANDAYAVGLADNAAVAYVGASFALLRLDLTTGAIFSVPSSVDFPSSVSVGAALPGQDVPALSTWAMLIAIAGLALLAIRRL